jgi:hypothetical protein
VFFGYTVDYFLNLTLRKLKNLLVMMWRNRFILPISIFTLIPFLVSAQCIDGDCVNGIGSYQFKSGSVYKGNFKEGQFHGYGKCSYADGDVYEGWWEERMPEGKGTLTKSGGSQVTGLWKRGILVDKSGEVLDSDFAEKTIGQGEIQIGCLTGNCKNGLGIMGFPSGARYEGTFMNGKFHGPGKWIYPYGAVFEGEYVENFAHGKGRITHSDNSVTTGIWENGDYLGDTREGNTRDCTHGDCGNIRMGIFKYQDGTVYTGEFKDGKPQGWGRVDYPTGEVYEGDWINDIANGYGTYTTLDGSDHVGIWENGSFVASKATHEKQKNNVIENYGEENVETKVWAVVIGVSMYTHMKPLKYSDNDAFRLMALMQSPAGGALPDEQIRVLVDEDATKNNIIASMKELFGKADQNDLVLLYFSGHGLRGSFLPIDYDGFNNKLHHDEIQEIFEASRAKYKLCIADACHSGSYAFNSKGEIEDIVSDYYEKLSKSKGGTALILSSKPEETSLESLRVRQGVFSHYLLRGMKGEADNNSNGVVTLGELFDYIADEVESYTQFRQSPVLKGDYDKDMPISVVRKK